MEGARSEFFRHLGLPFRDLQQEDTLFPVPGSEQLPELGRRALFAAPGLEGQVRASSRAAENMTTDYAD
jgi:hypothetical protein